MASAPTMSQAPAPASADRWRRRGKRAANEGSALVARGEPLIWLTCGALILVLTMIVGLILLVVFEGMQTFWPQPVVRVALANGSTSLGEFVRTDDYHPSESQLASMPSEEVEAYRQRVAGGDKRGLRRRLLRVGNFELSGEHFRWISDPEILPGGESEPEWAMVLERIAWGRFYGEPAEYVIRHPRTPSGDEEQLQKLVAFFEQNLSRLDENQQNEAGATLDDARGQLSAMRRESTEALRAKVAAADNPPDRIDAVLENGETVSGGELPKDGVVSELRQVWTSRPELWTRFQTDFPVVKSLFRRQSHLRKDDLGHINEVLNGSRMGVREAELESGLPLMTKADERRAVQGEIDAIAAAEEETRQFVRQTGRRFPGTPLATAAQAILEQLRAEWTAALAEPQERARLLSAEIEELPASAREALTAYEVAQERAARESSQIVAEIDEIQRTTDDYVLRMKTAGNDTADLPVADIVRIYPANRLSFFEKLGVYFSRWGEFLVDDPREANSEGGVFPAIWGTIAMTLIMSFAVVPFGVLAALYLREYARGGWIVSIVRIAVNNLAGVPSIVFGVFGLGFFCYLFGAYLDGGPANAGLSPWPPARWFFVLGTLAVTAVGAFLTGLFSMTSRRAEASTLKRWLGRVSLLAWIGATILIVVLIAKTPFFHGFYRAELPNPTYGKGGLIWASLTLALMTLPVVIVATEEALAAVPNSMREGSYACGASKWQTIVRIVLPRALPGIMTGMILAMARGAGEVAPLMLVGAVKLAPDLPVDLTPPFVHPSRSFMHLGFHIFDLGFQSANSEAAKPMVYTTTLLLIGIIACLNFSAIWLRARLRRRYRTAQF